MIEASLRHLRVFLALGEIGSVSRAAERCFITQPAVTQSMGKLEAETGAALFSRTPYGFRLTEAGEVLTRRVHRAIGLLDGALGDISPRLVKTATRAQMKVLVAASETQNISLAAARLGIAQPTAQRAIVQLEADLGRPLFNRLPHGAAPTRQCEALARTVRLAFVELDQAKAELGELAGRDSGRLSIGTMPLSLSDILPRALAAFRRQRPNSLIRVIEGSFDELLGGLRRGEIDFLIGALRDPLPIDDVAQELLFNDSLVIFGGGGHPLLSGGVTIERLQACPWIVPRAGTPARSQFDQMFQAAQLPVPRSIIESGSTILMRQLVQDGTHLACISRAQVQGEIARSMVQPLVFTVPGPSRPIGLTTRRGWHPTQAQAQLLEIVRSAV
jgi:LysR family transcriptional regulator, regulator for genes of the gallate degradation pathway